MENDTIQKLKISCDELEWLYAPNEEYVNYEGCKRYLQMIFPYRRTWEKNEKFPLVLFIPGSAWHRQEMYNNIPQYTHIAERGIFFAAIQYRESDIAVFPAQIYDVHNALNYLIEHAERLHINTERIYLAGNSSGGHIALLTSFTMAHGLYTDQCRFPYTITGVIAESAPADLMLCQSESLPPWMKTRPTADLLGVDSVKDNKALAEKASCEMYITNEVNLPPVLLVHGDQDTIVSVEQSRRLHKILKDNHKTVIYYELEGIDHGGTAFWTEDLINYIEKFIQMS
jgi:acetyl esterase/lipase